MNTPGKDVEKALKLINLLLLGQNFTLKQKYELAFYTDIDNTTLIV